MTWATTWMQRNVKFVYFQVSDLMINNTEKSTGVNY